MLEKRMAIIALVLVAVLTVGLLFYNWPYQDRLTERQKEDIAEAYKIVMPGGHSIVWYDENGGRRDPYVCRYFGTYGDCIVMLWYGNGQDGIYQPIKPPYRLSYLSRPVDFPVDVEILLYNTNPDYPNRKDLEYYMRYPITTMRELKYSFEITWLTDAQLEQLTTDLENWLAEGNY